MAKYATFRELIAWQKGMDLAERVYHATRSFPSAYLFTVGIQLRRAANSIPANVSEGFSRRSQGVYRSHVAIALGSLAEVQTLLELCRRLSLIPVSVIQALESLADEVGRLLFGLWRSPLVSTVCYSRALVTLFLGAWPWALGYLLHVSLGA